MHIRGVKIFSSVDAIYTQLLYKKTEEYLLKTFGKTEDYSNYIKSISFITKLDSKKSENRQVHFISFNGFNPKNKEIIINVDKNFVLVYESLYHEIQHAKNNGKDFYNFVLRDKYPYIYSFIDEYIAYKYTLNFMLHNELVKNEKICGWYRCHINARNMYFEKAYDKNITLLKTINLQGTLDQNLIEIDSEHKYNNIYSLAYMMAKIMVCGINKNDVKYKKLLKELDKIEGSIKNEHCKQISNVFIEILSDLDIYF